jgi:hypothetical protein
LQAKMAMLMAHSGPLGQESQEQINHDWPPGEPPVSGRGPARAAVISITGRGAGGTAAYSITGCSTGGSAAHPLTGRSSGSAHPLAVSAPDQLGQGPNQPGGAQSSPAPSRRQPRGRGGTPASCLPASQASVGSSLHQNQLMRRSRRVRYSRPSLPCPNRMPGLVGGPAFRVLR